MGVNQMTANDHFISLFFFSQMGVHQMITNHSFIALFQMGVHQMGIRAQLLKNIETAKEELDRAREKAKELEVRQNENSYGPEGRRN